MARTGNRTFKKSQTRTFTEVRGNAVVRVTLQKIKGQKLRDRIETVEVFQPVPALASVPGMWIGTFRTTK